MSAILYAAHGELPGGELPGDADGDGHPHGYDYDGLMVPAAGLRPGRRMIAVMLPAVAVLATAGRTGGPGQFTENPCTIDGQFTR